MRSTPSRPPWATTSCAPPGMTSSAGWKISRTATPRSRHASSCARSASPAPSSAAGVDVVPAGVADARRGPRPRAGRSGPATGSASRSARSATRYAASRRPEVGDQARAGQRPHAGSRPRSRRRGDERGRPRLGAGQLGVRVQVASHLHQLPRQPVHGRAQGVGEEGGGPQDLQTTQPARPSGRGTTGGAARHRPAAQVRSARPLLFSSSTRALTSWARARVVTSTASGVSTTTTSSSPSTATVRPDRGDDQPVGVVGDDVVARAEDLDPRQVVAVGDQRAERGEVAHVVPAEGRRAPPRPGRRQRRARRPRGRSRSSSAPATAPPAGPGSAAMRPQAAGQLGVVARPAGRAAPTRGRRTCPAFQRYSRVDVARRRPSAASGFSTNSSTREGARRTVDLERLADVGCSRTRSPGAVGSMPIVTSAPVAGDRRPPRATQRRKAVGSAMTWSAAKEPRTRLRDRGARGRPRPGRSRPSSRGATARRAGSPCLRSGQLRRTASSCSTPVTTMTWSPHSGASRSQVACSSERPVPVRSCRNFGRRGPRQRPQPGARTSGGDHRPEVLDGGDGGWRRVVHGPDRRPPMRPLLRSGDFTGDGDGGTGTAPLERRRAGSPVPVAGNVTGAQEGSALVVYGRGHVRRVASLRLRRGLLGGAGTRLTVAGVVTQVPARPHRHGALAAAGHLGPARAAGRRADPRGHRRAPGRRPHAAADLGRRPARRALAARLDGGDRPGRRDARAPRSRRGHRVLRGRPRHRRARLRRGSVREAVEVARTGLLVTIGIEPTYASTGFGYIRVGEPLGSTAPTPSRSVRREAGSDTAGLAGDGIRWNAGMFVVQATVLLDLLASYQPELARGLGSGRRIEEVARAEEGRDRPRGRRARRRPVGSRWSPAASTGRATWVTSPPSVP